MEKNTNLDTSIKMVLVGMDKKKFTASTNGSLTECLAVALKLDHIIEPIMAGVLYVPNPVLDWDEKGMVYFSNHDARLLVEGKIDETEYLNLYHCDSLCRNTQELCDENTGFDIEIGSLFMKSGDEMTLIDRDCTYYTTYKEYAFEILNY